MTKSFGPKFTYYERNDTNAINLNPKPKSCGWKKFPNKDLGGNDVIYGKTWKTNTPEECQAKCDADSRCKSIMWATNYNPNRWYRQLCWLKTKGRGYESKYRRGTGIDVYQRNDCSATAKQTPKGKAYFKVKTSTYL